MLAFFKRHRETLLVTLLGLVIFSLLNLMMVQWHPDRWTNTHFGAWSCFQRGWTISGFDQFTYIITSEWRPMYDLYRHPLLAFMVWPLSEINKCLKDWTDINCAIYVVAVVWTLISTFVWWLFYRIMRKFIGLTWRLSLLLTLFFFGFSHVMLITFVEDHMLLTMTMLLLTINLLADANKNGRVLSLWKIMILYFVGTGITTTNSIKIWLMDMVGRYNHSLSIKRNILILFKRSLWFFIPTLLVGGIYLWELDNTQQQEEAHREHIVQTKLRTDSTFRKNWAKQQIENKQRNKELSNKQLTDNKYLQWTDTSIDRLPLVWENIFGEGLILHEEHLLEDANARKNARPVFVEYSHWYDHAMELVIIVLFITGLWFGRKERLMYLCLLPLLFDVLLHVGLTFAASDVYIMTAHWAFIIPICVGFMMKRLSTLSSQLSALSYIVVACVTVFLWWHNLTLIYSHIIG